MHDVRRQDLRTTHDLTTYRRAVSRRHRETPTEPKPQGNGAPSEPSSVATGPSALVLEYIDERATDADMASRVADLVKLVLELQAGWHSSKAQRGGPRSWSAPSSSSVRKTRRCARGFVSLRLASDVSSPSAFPPSS